uniref:Uncharacterized protein n=1 Tax=Caenorhabditis japonica TaxID=281687 RepID=A0A8R1E8Q0_CAEJA
MKKWYNVYTIIAPTLANSQLLHNESLPTDDVATCAIFTQTFRNLCADFGKQVNSVDSVRKFRSRLMKDGKPDEYAMDEASNFQFADSP